MFWSKSNALRSSTGIENAVHAGAVNPRQPLLSKPTLLLYLSWPQTGRFFTLTIVAKWKSDRLFHQRSISPTLIDTASGTLIWTLPGGVSKPAISLSIPLGAQADSRSLLENFPTKSSVKPPVFRAARPYTVKILSRWPISELCMGSFRVGTRHDDRSKWTTADMHDGSLCCGFAPPFSLCHSQPRTPCCFFYHFHHTHGFIFYLMSDITCWHGGKAPLYRSQRYNQF